MNIFVSRNMNKMKITRIMLIVISIPVGMRFK